MSGAGLAALVQELASGIRSSQKATAVYPMNFFARGARGGYDARVRTLLVRRTAEEGNV